MVQSLSRSRRSLPKHTINLGITAKVSSDRDQVRRPFASLSVLPRSISNRLVHALNSHESQPCLKSRSFTEDHSSNGSDQEFSKSCLNSVLLATQ